MPAKNTVKQYKDNSYYHIYNRGVEKRTIFTDEKDYKTFLSYLQIYLSTQEKKPTRLNLVGKNWRERQFIIRSLSLNNFSEEIDLLAYCLMPNHFHLLLKQKPATAIKSFMQSLATKYSIYFNRRHDRVGSLFQSVFKAVEIKSEEQLVYLSKYIHLNPIEANLPNWKYSSLSNYLRQFSQIWVKPDEILALFSENNPNLSYNNFIKEEDGVINLNEESKID
jgi:putative transposase